MSKLINKSRIRSKLDQFFSYLDNESGTADAVKAEHVRQELKELLDLYAQRAKPTYGPPVSSMAQRFEISSCVTVYIDKASGQLWEYRSHKNLSDEKRWNYWSHASECPRVWAMFLA